MGTRLGTRLGTQLGTVLGTDLGGASSNPPVHYINNFSSTAYYLGAANSGEPGTNVATWWTLEIGAIEDAAVAGPANFRATSGRLGASTGYTHLITGANNDEFSFGLDNGAGAFINASSSSRQFRIAAGNSNQLMVRMVCWRGSALDLARQWYQGKRFLTDLPCVDYGPYVSGFYAVSRAGNSNLYNATKYRYVGSMGGTGEPTDADAYAIYTAIRAAGDVPAPGSVPGTLTVTHRFSVKDMAATVSAPATITDTVGGTNLTRTGTPGFGIDTAPAWIDYLENADRTGPDVWLGVGDSEMEGVASTAGLPPAGIVGTYPPFPYRLYMVKNTTAVVSPLAHPTGSNSGVGPDGFFGHLRIIATGRHTIVVNAGRSGLRSSDQLPGSAPYLNVLAQLDIAMAIPGAVFKGVIHFDGYNDAATGVPANWTTNWFNADPLLGIRSGLYAARSYMVGKPWILHTINSTYSSPPAGNVTSVRNQQLAMANVTDANGTVYVATGPDLALIGDGIHPTVNAEYQVAQQMNAVVP